MVHLCQAVELVDHRPQFPVAPPVQLVGHRLPTAGDDPQVEVERLCRLGNLGHHLEGGGGEEGVGDAAAGHDLEGALWGETLLVGHHRMPEHQGGKEDVEQTSHPGPVGRRVEHRGLVESDIEEELEGEQVALDDPLGVESPLGMAGASRGVEQHRRVARRGIDRFEPGREALRLGQRALARARLAGDDHGLEVRQLGSHQADAVGVGLGHDDRLRSRIPENVAV